MDVRLRWDGGGPTVFYDHAQSGAVGPVAGARIAGLLLLQLALVTDLSIEAPNAALESQARRIAGSIGDAQTFGRSRPWHPSMNRHDVPFPRHRSRK